MQGGSTTSSTHSGRHSSNHHDAQYNCTVSDIHLNTSYTAGHGHYPSDHAQYVMYFKFTIIFHAGCSEGALRLRDGATMFEGQLEVCYNKEWCTVCNDFYTSSNCEDAKVACRQLGFSSIGRFYETA